MASLFVAEWRGLWRPPSLPLLPYRCQPTTPLCCRMIPFFGTLVKGVCKDVLHMSDEAAGTLGLLAGICTLDPSGEGLDA